MIGSSYEGFTVVMALLNPHPALKVAAPESPMVDGWKGDDWFHYGAFRQPNIDYILGQTTNRGEGVHVAREGRDDYSNDLRAGFGRRFARSHWVPTQLPYWKIMLAHPAYDGFWQSAGARQADHAKAAHRADHVGAGPLGPGGYVGRDPFSYRALKATGDAPIR